VRIADSNSFYSNVRFTNKAVISIEDNLVTSVSHKLTLLPKFERLTIPKETLAFPTYWTGWIRFYNGRVLHKINLKTYGSEKQDNLLPHLRD